MQQVPKAAWGDIVTKRLLFGILLSIIVFASCTQSPTQAPETGQDEMVPQTEAPTQNPEPASTSIETPPTNESLSPMPTETQTSVVITVSPSAPYLHSMGEVYSSGNMTFQEVSAFGHYVVSSIEIADLDSDGDMDLILASEENDSIIQVYENLGEAVFRNSGNTFAFQSPDKRHWNFGITVADFNGDGSLDIATADAWAGINIYFNYGDLRFNQVQNFTFEGMGEVKGIASADLDNDGDVDIILGDHNGENRGDRILLNNGYGKMIDSGQSIGWDITWDVFITDINRDGAQDYISINRYAQQPSRVHLNNGSGFFQTTYDIPDALDDSYDIKGFAKGDYTYFFIANSEGKNRRQNRMLVFDGAGKLVVDKRFGQVGAETKDMCLVDLNSDGLPDLVTGNYNWGSIVYYSKLDSSGLLNFENSMPLFSIERTSAIGYADFNGDGLVDFIVGIEDRNGDFCQYYLLLQK